MFVGSANSVIAPLITAEFMLTTDALCFISSINLPRSVLRRFRRGVMQDRFVGQKNSVDDATSSRIVRHVYIRFGGQLLGAVG